MKGFLKMDIRIGIIGPGNIANRFAAAAPLCTGVKITAVASRDLQKSSAFAEKYGIEKAYGSYKEILNDNEIDAIYISTIHTLHFEQIIASLNAGKSVICEKPSLLTVSEAEQVIALAKEKNLLFMEAMWTRLLPAVLKAREWVSEGKIGDLKLITASFGGISKFNPESRIFAPEKAGGSLYDVGIYSLSFAMFIANSPIKEYKTMITPTCTNVDETFVGLVKFDNNALAQISSSIAAPVDDTGYIYGNEGKIVLQNFWACTKVIYTAKNGEEEVWHDTYGDDRDSLYEGFKYEIQHFADLLKDGKTESPIVTYDYIMNCVKFFEDSLKELNQS